jgi:hypothetical protein
MKIMAKHKGQGDLYTGSGLRRVKPYVQLLVLYCCWGERTYMVLGRTSLAALYSLADKVGGPGVHVGYNRETYLKSVTTLSYNLRTVWRHDQRLAMHAKSRIGLSLLVELSWRFSGPQIMSIGPTVRFASLLMGRTHLSGTTVSLDSRTQGYPYLTLMYRDIYMADTS